jgi:ankyrin repeat protein
MEKKISFILALILLLNMVTMPIVLADSPVTSTPIYEAYLDVELVAADNKWGTITEEIASFLKSEDNSLDVKIALINAIYQKARGWTDRDNAELYTSMVYQTELNKLEINQLSADELVVLGYLLLLDNYINPEIAKPYLIEAIKKKPRSFSAHMILALFKAQSMNGCEVWTYTRDIAKDKNLVEDRLRTEAIIHILDYTSLYREDCVSMDDLLIIVDDHLQLYSQEPLVIQGTTMVPLRGIFETLGATVQWDKKTQTITAKKETTTVILKIGDKTAKVNSGNVQLLQPAQIINGSTLVPLRFIGESLGALVEYSPKTKKINIISKDYVKEEIKVGKTESKLNHEALINATINNNTEKLLELINSGVNVNLQPDPEIDDPVLQYAIRWGAAESFYLLIEHGANVNTEGVFGITPLMTAANTGNLEFVKHLIEKGANVNAKSTAEETPLMYAATQPNTEIVNELLKAGAKVNDVSKNGYSALMLAAYYDYAEILQILISNQADANIVDSKGWNALFYAARGTSLNSTTILLQKGVAVNSKDSEGNTPLIIAAYNGYLEKNELYFRGNLDRSTELSKEEYTALEKEISDKNLKIVKALLSAGADKSIKNNEGYTALMIAKDEGNQDLVNLLMN